MLEINHKDENKLNNRLDNLELVTRTQNNKYGNRIKKAAATMSKRVYQYTKDLKLVKEWDSTKDCHRIGGFKQSMVA
jgi:ribosomal protein RSM22 (predicted rRNA methylase)